jgi:peptidoglycan/xylan/chitin deacetylase (PgdA/CDA1 family)
MKRLLLDTGLASRAVRLAGRLRRREPRALIIRYHAILEPDAPAAAVVPAGISHTPAQLQGHLEVLRRHFNILAVQDLVTHLEEGRPLPDRSVVLTFDDGFADNLVVAAPLLARYDVRAGFFLTTGLIGTSQVPWFVHTLWLFTHATAVRWIDPTFGREWPLDTPTARTAARRAANLACAAATATERAIYLQQLEHSLAAPPLPLQQPLMLDWQQAAQLRDAGHCVDSHTVTHPNMALLSWQDALAEAALSRSHLREHLGVGGDVFCYPNPFGKPNADTLTREILRHAGYRAALLVDAGLVGARTDLLGLPRVHSPPEAQRFHLALERHFAGRS